MNRLLRANFSRLFKNKPFWICFAIPLALDLLALLVELLSKIPFRRTQVPLEPQLFGNAESIGLLLSIFAGMFFGTEHSDGGLRNKLIVGHSRVKIYLANLITCAAAGVMMFAADFTVNLALGLAREHMRSASWGEILLRVWIVVCAIAAVSAILVLIVMLVRSRSGGVTFSICVYLAMTICAAMIVSKLAEPEYLTPMTVTYLEEFDENGETRTETVTEKNPNYVGGTAREVLETLNDLLPVSQMIRTPEGGFDNGAALPGYSVGILLIFTIGGTLSFRKLDLK